MKITHDKVPLRKLTHPLLDEKIVQIAKSQGGVFGVRLLWRDDNIRRACKRLKKKGVFKQTKYGAFEQFKLIDELHTQITN